MGKGTASNDVASYCLAIILLAVLLGIVRTLSRVMIFNAGRDIEYELRGDLYKHLQNLQVGYYQSQSTGDLMSRVVNDVSAVRMLLGPGILNMINTPLYYVYGLTMMFTISVPLTIMAILPIPAFVLCVKRIRELLMVRSLKVQEGMASLSTKAQENLSGMHVVKAYVQEENEIRSFVDLNRDFQEKNMGLARVRAVMQPLVEGIGSFALLFVIAYASRQIARGRLTIGDLFAFIVYLNALAWPTAALGWTFSLYERGRAAMRRLEEVFAIQPSIRDAPNARLPRAIQGEVEFRDVEFAYGTAQNGMSVLKRVSFKIPAGSTVAIVGRTGAGKSSLVHLIPRLYDARDGSVFVDGLDVRDWSLKGLRDSIALVSQDPFLFSATVRNNILFGVDGLKKETIEWLVQASGLAGDLKEFPQGMETVVGERGITLSGGQKQRTTLARALARDPKILILDDALSSVDSHTEEQILSSIRSVMRKRTSIIISHRLSAVKDSDRILVIEDGELVEQGAHDELMRLGGVYADLFARQQLSEELEVLA